MARKKKIIFFETKPLTEAIAEAPITEYEDFDILIKAPKGFPPPLEVVKTSKYVPGSFLFTANAFVGNPSFFDPKTDKIALCLSIIRELDKGNKGFFNNAYFMNCDILTPKLKQFEFFKEQFLNFWKPEVKPTEDLLMSQFGTQMRLYIRNIIFRLFSYYYMGYSVTFSKHVKQEEVKESIAAN